jgi:hypothetical protein
VAEETHPVHPGRRSPSSANGIGGYGGKSQRRLAVGGHERVVHKAPASVKQAENSTAAKLFLNRQLSAEMQNGSFNGWSVRTDVTPRRD